MSDKEYSETVFESIKHIDEYGCEYWLARELQDVLEYVQWRRFNEVINKAIMSCDNSKLEINEHFADVGKMIKLAKGAERKISDYKLSRYACYLIVQNANPKKEVVAIRSNIFCCKNKNSRNK